MAAERYDDLMGMILKEAGGYSGFMEGFFGFLRRRTDFYAYALQGDRMGFPPGTAEQLLFSHYMKYRQDYNDTHPPPPGIQLPYRQATPEEMEQMRKDGRMPPKEEEGKEAPEEGKAEEEPPKAKAVEPVPEPAQLSVTAGGEVEGKYKWSQDITGVEVQVSLPPGTRSKDMLVKITVRHIKVALKAKPNEPFLEGDLFERVQPDNCLWTMDGNSIVLNLEKAVAVVWKSVLLGEEQGDIHASVQ